MRSVGYSELFVLSREDVLAALKDHPDAEVMAFNRPHLLQTLSGLKKANNDDVLVSLNRLCVMQHSFFCMPNDTKTE